MARITVADIKKNLNNSESWDIFNAIRNDSSETFQRYVGLADANNISKIASGMEINQTVQNEFVQTLIDRIGLVVMNKVLLSNPLKKFKKGTLEYGRTIEEIFTDITKAKKYDVEDSESTVFKREIPNVKTLFHERNRQEFYQATVQDESLKTAFTSWNNFDSFIATIINSIYNSAEVDEYGYMMLLIESYYKANHFKVIPIADVVSEATAREFVKKVRATATKMTLPQGSRDFNSLAVHTRTDMNGLHLFIDADYLAEIDVEVLARAFNMGKSDFLGNVTVIDDFAVNGLKAVLVDEDWFMVYDNNTKMETIRNPKGLYWNYFYHVWQTLSVSRFSNAVAFVTGAVAPVTEVIVNPSIISVKQGKKQTFKAFVRFTVGKTSDYPVTWSILGNTTGGAVQAGTTINATTGEVTVATDQVKPFIVQATVSYTEGGSTKTVVGESIVTPIPTV